MGLRLVGLSIKVVRVFVNYQKRKSGRRGIGIGLGMGPIEQVVIIPESMSTPAVCNTKKERRKSRLTVSCL
jgi:hypothetical protein